MLVPTPLPSTEVKKAYRALQTAATTQDGLSSFKFLNFSGWLDLQLAAQKRALLKFAGNDSSSSGCLLPRPSSEVLSHSKSLPALSSVDESAHHHRHHGRRPPTLGQRGLLRPGPAATTFAGKWINRGIGIEEFYTPHVPQYRLLHYNTATGSL